MNISSILASTKVQSALATINQTKTAVAANPMMKLLPTPQQYLIQVGICYGLGTVLRQFDRTLRVADKETRLDAFVNLAARHPELTSKDLDYLVRSVPSVRKESKTDFSKRMAKDVARHSYQAVACANWSYYFWYSAPVWVGSRVLGYTAEGVVNLAQSLRGLLGGDQVKARFAKHHAAENRKAFVRFLDRYTIKAAWYGMQRNLGESTMRQTASEIENRPDVYDLYEDLKHKTVTTADIPSRPSGERVANWDLIRMGKYTKVGYDRCQIAYRAVLDELPENCEVDDPRRFGAAMATHVQHTKRSQLDEARKALPYFILLELVDGRGDEGSDFTDTLGLLVIEGWDDVVGAKVTTK